MARKSLRFFIALTIGKTVKTIQKLIRMNGTYFPGKLAIIICPDFLNRIDKPKTIIAVTGTNGKTTVCNMIIDILKENGIETLNNRAGSNTNAGIGTALLSEATFSGKAKHQLAILEIDERSSKLIYPYINPTYMVCTNLFRDSIQRNAHAEYIADIISSALPATTKLILNADDCISNRLAPQNQRVYFGIDQLPTDKQECTNIINDCQICPECSTRLKFHYGRYHHIGKVYCPNCTFASPESDYLAKIFYETQTMVMMKDKEEETYQLISNSIFNSYNQVTVIATLNQIGLSPDQIRKGLEKINIVESRYSKEEVEGVELITHMAKGHNPIACSCVFDYAVHEEGIKEIVLLPDDYKHTLKTSENITWAYDADFELLNDPKVERIVIGGSRSADYRLRLLIAGVSPKKIFIAMDEQDTFLLLKLEKTEKVFILHQLFQTQNAKKVKDNSIDVLRKSGLWA